MATAYAPVAGADGARGRGVTGGMRLRFKPLQLAILFGIGLLIGLPLLAGSERRDQLKDYFAKTAMGGNTFAHPSLHTHIAPPSGGISDSEGLPLTLEARLKHFLSLPALDQWEAELSNRYACPMFTYSRNTYFFHDGKDEGWKKITKDDVRRYRQKMVDYFRELDREGTKLVWDRSMEAKTRRGERRGIIYTGSGAGKDLARMRVSLHFLRNVIKSKLPVEIFHFPGEFTNATAREELARDFNVDIRETKKDKGDTGGKVWSIKNKAFVESKFTQFVYMDSVSGHLSRLNGRLVLQPLTAGQLPPRGSRGALRVRRVQALRLRLLGRLEQGPSGQRHLACPRPHMQRRGVARRVWPGYL